MEGVIHPLLFYNNFDLGYQQWWQMLAASVMIGSKFIKAQNRGFEVVVKRSSVMLTELLFHFIWTYIVL